MVLPKRRFKMCITKLDSNLKVVSKDWITPNFNNFKANLNNRTIEIVNDKPEKFAFNQLYMRADRKIIWVWVNVEDDNT